MIPMFGSLNILVLIVKLLALPLLLVNVYIPILCPTIRYNFDKDYYAATPVVLILHFLFGREATSI